MNFTVNTQTLVQELRLLRNIVPTRPTLPILAYARFSANDAGLALFATDLEVGLSTQCAARVEVPGDVAVPVATLLAMVEQCPNADMVFTAQTHRINIRCEGFTSNLQTLPATEMPALAEVTGQTVALAAPDLQRLLTQTRYAIGSGGAYMIRGALLTTDETRIVLVATDGKRLAVATQAQSDGQALRVIIPMKMMDVLCGQLEHGQVLVTIGERLLCAEIGTRVWLSRSIDATFPSYERIIPQHYSHTIRVDRKALAAALRRVGLLSDVNRAMYLEVSSDTLRLLATSAGVGDTEESVPIEGYQGEMIRLCVDWRMMLEWLDVAQDATITITLKDALSALLLTDGDQHLGVVMLMRL